MSTLQKARSKDSQNQRPERPDQAHEHSLDKTIEDSFPASDPPSSIPDPDEHAA